MKGEYKFLSLWKTCKKTMKECRACEATYDDKFMYCPICAKPLLKKTTTKLKVSSGPVKPEPVPAIKKVPAVKPSKKAATLKAACQPSKPEDQKSLSKFAAQKEAMLAAPKVKPVATPAVEAIPMPPKRAPAPMGMPITESVAAAVPAPPKRAPAPKAMPIAEPVVAAIPLPPKRAPAPKAMPITEPVASVPVPQKRAPAQKAVPVTAPVMAAVPTSPKRAPAPKAMPIDQPITIAVPLAPKRAPASKAVPITEPVASVPVPPKRAPAPKAMQVAEPIAIAVPSSPKHAPAPRVIPIDEPITVAYSVPPKRAPAPRPVSSNAGIHTASVSSTSVQTAQIPGAKHPPMQRTAATIVPSKEAGPPAQTYSPQKPMPMYRPDPKYAPIKGSSFATVANQKISQADLEADSYYDDVVPADYGEAAEKRQLNKTKMIQAAGMIIGLIILVVIVAINL